MQKYILIGLVSAVTLVHANQLTFINKDFDSFCKQIVPEIERAKFYRFYQEVEQKIVMLNRNEQLKRRHTLYDQAIKSLQNEHKIWADAITTFLTDLKYLDSIYDQERSQVRVFLERYGSYKEYEQKNGLKTMPLAESNAQDFWNNFKVQFVKITEKIGGWFKSLRA